MTVLASQRAETTDVAEGGSPMNTVIPGLNRSGKSVMRSQTISPRTPCGRSTRATARNPLGGSSSLDDVDIDAGTLAGSGRFDDGSESSDDLALASNDLANI